MKFSKTLKARLVKMAIAKFRKYEGEMWKLESGSYNKFMPLTESWGAKLSTSKERIIGNFKRQRRAARYGLGPIALCVFRVGEWYGYITQTVKPAGKGFWQEQVVNHPEYFRVVKKLHKLTMFKFGDAHGHNFGLINGKVVCIDFDPDNVDIFEKHFAPRIPERRLALVSN